MKVLSCNKKYDMDLSSDEKKVVKDYLYPDLKIAIIIPAYNEEKNIEKTLSKIPSNLSNKMEIVVIDDGSRDRTCQIARRYGAIVIRHKKNKGNGAAIQTGLEFSSINDYKIAIIIDADGQHEPEDIPKFIEPIINNNVDFVIGNRFAHYYDMSPIKKICSRVMSVFYTILFQKKVSDPTMGYRALTSKIFKNIEFQSYYSITQEMLLKIVPKYEFHEVATKIYEREYGESFISIRKYFQKSLFSIFKFYLFPKFCKIFNSVINTQRIEGKINKYIKT